ncbi:hypothetical protein QFZ94_006858 [Paraburkholderia sp. JPY465]
MDLYRIVRHDDAPVQSRADGVGQFFVAVFVVLRQPDLHFDDHGLDTGDALRGFLGREFLCEARWMTGKRHDTVCHFDTDICRSDGWIPIEFVLDFTLQLAVGFHHESLRGA